MAHAVAELARAELAGWDDDHAVLDQAGRRALGALAGAPAVAQQAVLDPLVDVALRFGHMELAASVVQESLTLSRDLAERIATPEALRDLSISLDNAARVAQATDRPAVAIAFWREALDEARRLVEREATEANRELVDYLETRAER